MICKSSYFTLTRRLPLALTKRNKAIKILKTKLFCGFLDRPVWPSLGTSSVQRETWPQRSNRVDSGGAGRGRGGRRGQESRRARAPRGGAGHPPRNSGGPRCLPCVVLPHTSPATTTRGAMPEERLAAKLCRPRLRGRSSKCPRRTCATSASSLTSTTGSQRLRTDFCRLLGRWRTGRCKLSSWTTWT